MCMVMCKYYTIVYKGFSICGFWFCGGSWNQSPVDIKG